MVDTVLAFVEQLLTYLQEFDAAAIVAMVKDFIASLLG